MSDILTGKKVEIYLKTPLFAFKYKEKGEVRGFMEDVVHISATLVADRAGGFIVDVSAVSDQKKTDTSPPLKRVFIPSHKIDFMIIT